MHCKICNKDVTLGMHEKPNSLAISNWSRHASQCQRIDGNQPLIKNFLTASDSNEIDINAHGTNPPVKDITESPDFNLANEQVFQEAPPNAQK